jgi:uncharacterized protein (DUF362 family)
MPPMTRREFVKWAGTGLGVVAAGPLLAACQPSPATSAATPPPATSTQLPPTNSPRPTLAPTSASSPSASTAPAGSPTAASPTATAVPANTATPAPLPELVVARAGEPEALVRQALAALGGMQRFVTAGQDVIIKPNICVAYHPYEYAATTNPWVVAALVKLCLEAGARRVRVMDSPFGGTAQEAYAKSGIQEQVAAAGGQMEFMAGFKYVKTQIPQGRSLHATDIYGDILKADVLINVPIAKNHSLARLTLGMKNLMGVIVDRTAIHSSLGQRLADLSTIVRPALTVVDATRILMANGPTGGNLSDVKKLDTLIASPDIVAADSYAATLFGLKPTDLDYVRAAAAMGLGQSDLSQLRIQEFSVVA